MSHPKVAAFYLNPTFARLKAEKPLAMQRLTRSQIDDDRWNALVAQHNAGLPYGYTWYLDAATNGQWEAYMLDDYEAVFPVAFTSRPLRQGVTPPLVQQLCWYASREVLPTEVAALITQLRRRYHKLYLPLSHSTEPALWPHELQERTNLILPLANTYDYLRAGYSRSLRKRINKAAKRLTCQIEALSVSQLRAFYLDNTRHGDGIPAEVYTRIEAVLAALLSRDMGHVYTARDEQGELQAAGCLAVTPQRVINLFGASTRDSYGMHLLIDRVIQDYAGQDKLLDFEGSEIPGVAQFFESFGAVLQPYYVYSWDRIPAWARRLYASVRR